MLETNEHSQSVYQHCIGEKGVTTDEKGVLIQIQTDKVLLLV